MEERIAIKALNGDMMNKSVEEYLNEVSYNFEGYIPSEESLEFVNFIKLVEGDDLENKTPIVHMKLLDNVFSKKKKHAILCHRGFAKSTLLTVYFPLYIAVFGKLPNFGTVNYVLMVLDSMEGGAKTVRKSLEMSYNNSDFLRKYIRDVRFTDAFIELENIDGHRLGIKLAGAQQSIRGTRFTNSNGSHRPELAIIDDILSDTDAKSPTVIANVENTLHKAVNKALKPGKNKTVYIGTIFSKSDPLARVIETGNNWDISCYPVCEKFPCTKEEFRGSWEDRFSYDVVKEMYDDAVAMGRLMDFNGEMMNRVMSDEDRLIQDSDIVWYERKNVLKNKGKYNFYITTDFATSEKTSADYSVVSVWGYNNNGDWLYVDGICKRQNMSDNMNDLFRLVSMYKPLAVGVEVSGQQGGFVNWIQNEMITRNVYFSLASRHNSNSPGIRPNTNKLVRFNTVVPLFKAKKIWFPEELKNDKTMVEAMDELRNVSVSGFKSKHDDFSDSISMLSELHPIKPSNDTNYEVNSNGVFIELNEDDITPNNLIF
jgi:predicted phage terminase large subunit-like protein